MFRGFRHPVKRPVQTAAEVDLRKARWWLQKGQFAKAGLILAQLARQAEGSERLRLAAELHSRAAHCLVEGSVEATGLSESQAALRVFSNMGDTERCQRFLENILRKLQAHHMPGAVGALQTEFGGAPAAREPAAGPLRLPTACPQCGAPVRGDEVEWIDLASAVCTFCGAVIETREN